MSVECRGQNWAPVIRFRALGVSHAACASGVENSDGEYRVQTFMRVESGTRSTGGT